MAFDNYYNEHKALIYSQLPKRLPGMRYVEQHSILHYIGDVRNKNVLDLACGEGRYTRLMKELGASEAVGVDISHDMIHLAKKREGENPVGCIYHIADAKAMEKIKEFDLVIAAFLLVYAESIYELSQFARVIYDNLKPGGRFVSITSNSFSKTFWGDTLQSYGFVFEKEHSTSDGTRFQLTWPGTENCCDDASVINYHYKPEVYEKVFNDVGFSEFYFRNVMLSDEGTQAYPEGFWDAYMANPPGMIIEVTK